MIESGLNSDKQNKYNRLVRETKKITGSKEGEINCSHLKEANKTTLAARNGGVRTHDEKHRN